MLKELLYFSDLPPLLILVIMEDTLRYGERSCLERMERSVLIPILMEDTLREIR